MSMQRNRLRITFTLISYLLSGGIGGSGTLCIGADGHVEIEAADTGCCSAENSSIPIEEDPCGACWDIPLLHEHIPSSGTKAHFSSLTPFAPPAFCSLPVRDSDSSTPAQRQIDRISPGEISSAHLQCTILLC